MTQKREMEKEPKMKRARKAAAKPAAESAPYVEQVSELLMIHNKNDPKAGVQTVSEADENGNCKTVPADERHENEFLKFDKNSSILENFIKNFWSQFREPTHFRLIRLTFQDYKRNRQAIKDLAEGKQTDAVKEFLKHYEIRPKKQKEEQNKNLKQDATMAKKQTVNEQPAAAPQYAEQHTEVQQAAQQSAQQPVQEEQPQGPSYRYNENMIDWEGLKNIGVSKEMLERMGVLDGMLKGYKTNKLVQLSLNLPGLATVRMDARLSFMSNPNGEVTLGIHGIRREPELERPYFGHIFTEEDKRNLRESGNLGRVVNLDFRNNGNAEPCLVSLDKVTNELVAVRQEHVFIPDEIKGVKLEPDEIARLKNGEAVYVDGMTSKNGKEFNATIQYSAERRGIEYIFPKDQVFNQQTLGGVKLSPEQLKMLSEGHTILVEDMKRSNGTTFSSFVTQDPETSQLKYTRHNPETGEIYIPKEINEVRLTPEDREALRKGQPVFLENMISRDGREFSSFVRLNMNNGYPQYSRTPDGFSEQQEARIPAEVYGKVLSAKERADLQDGKAVLLSGLKGKNGKEFSSYAKVNPSTGILNFYQENPDRKRNISRNVAQAETTQSQQQKRSAKQAV